VTPRVRGRRRVRVTGRREEEGLGVGICDTATD